MLVNENRTFGVEIETVGKTVSEVAEILRCAGIRVIQGGYSTRPPAGTWVVKGDGSLSSDTGSRDETAEVVSPVLAGSAGLAEARRVCDALQAAGIYANQTCGLHVHVGAGDLSLATLANVVARYIRFQGDILAMLPRGRRDSRYAYPMRGDYPYTSRLTRAGVSREWIARDAGAWDRYYAVNLASLARHGTIEFRQHSGSVNGETITRWVAFVIAFVEASIVRDAAPVARAATGTPARGRRPNYAGRRALCEALANGAAIETLVNVSGYEAGTLAVSILPQLRGMGRVTRIGDTYRFTVGNESALRRWLGEGVSLDAPAAPAPAAPVAPVPSEPDTLFRAMPPAIVSHYRERMMEFA